MFKIEIAEEPGKEVRR